MNLFTSSSQDIPLNGDEEDQSENIVPRTDLETASFLVSDVRLYSKAIIFVVLILLLILFFYWDNKLSTFFYLMVSIILVSSSFLLTFPLSLALLKSISTFSLSSANQAIVSVPNPSSYFFEQDSSETEQYVSPPTSSSSSLLSSLLNLSHMNELCVDKEGTLVSTQLTIHKHNLFTNSGFTISNAIFFVALITQKYHRMVNKEIARGLTGSLPALASDAKAEACLDYIHHASESEKEGLDKFQDFKLKRIICVDQVKDREIIEFSHPTYGSLLLCKGPPLNVLKFMMDKAVVEVENYEEISVKVAQNNEKQINMGYKTLGISIKKGDGPWQFVSVISFYNAPFPDTHELVHNIRHAGVNIKMLTVDSLNSARLIAQLVNLGSNISIGEEIRDYFSPDSHALVHSSDGFAQITSRDRLNAVYSLKESYGRVVGITGDGLQHISSLTAATCGFAVNASTDSVKDAATFILLQPGLIGIYKSLIESRRLSSRLKSILLFRFTGMIQMLSTLLFYVYLSDCSLPLVSTVVLILLNDLTIVPLSFDTQNISKTPQTISVSNSLQISCLLGFVQTSCSLFFTYVLFHESIFQGDTHLGHCNKQVQGILWTQLSLSTIFFSLNARASSYFWKPNYPSRSLALYITASTAFILLFSSLLASSEDNLMGPVYISDACIVVLYNLLCLALVDIVKILIYKLTNESLEPLDCSFSTIDKAVDNKKEVFKRIQREREDIKEYNELILPDEPENTDNEPSQLESIDTNTGDSLSWVV